MAQFKPVTVGERLYWSYANLAMAEMAVHNKDVKYARQHFMIRARLFKGLTMGTMSPRSLMRDQRIRMKLPQECVYCGATEKLSIDHIVATDRGGADTGDNAIWACRGCNSSKSNKDLFEWWFGTRQGFPPLFVIRIYLKQAMAYFLDAGLMDRPWAEVQGTPFAIGAVPIDYPAPALLTFTPFHTRKGATEA